MPHPQQKKPVVRAKDGDTDVVAIGREELDLARKFAKGQRVTIRSTVECAIRHYLHSIGRKVEPPASADAVRIMCSRDSGKTWEKKILVQQESGLAVAEDGLTYQKDSHVCRGPFRWRWPHEEGREEVRHG